MAAPSARNLIRHRALLHRHPIRSTIYRQQQHPYATAVFSESSAPLDPALLSSMPSTISLHPPTQPPSHKPPEFRKSQLHRSYTSLIRSSPVMLFFQHNNLKATEWAGIRRELAAAVAAAAPDTSSSVRLQVIQTGIFAAAVRVVEHSDVGASPDAAEATDHGLSKAAHEKTTIRLADRVIPRATSLDPMLSGPLAVLSFGEASPVQLAAALRVLSPVAGGAFAAPKRKAAPGLYEPAVQAGLAKLLMLGARVEGRAMDGEGVRWVGGITGGLDGLRAQLVHTLQGAGMALAGVLEGASKSLWVAVESRRLDLEGSEKGEKDA